MDFLKSLPTRTEAVGETNGTHKRDRIVLSSSSDGEEECEQIARKRPKKKISIDDSGRSLKLGLNLRDDYIEIDEIKRRPVPREDGLQWSTWEQTTQAESSRPYNKTYMDDQVMRQKILSNNQDYAFMTLLAGALRKELSDIVDPEDLSRLAQERESERLQTSIELKRTRIDMDKKYELVQKLKDMAREEEARFNTLRAQELPHSLVLLSRYLVDTIAIPTSFGNEQYGFLDLLELVKSYGSEQVSKETRDELANEVLSDREQETITSKYDGPGEELFFYLYVYYRGFLDNSRGYSLSESLRKKLLYALESYTELTGELLTQIKKEEGQSTTSTSSTTLPTVETQMDQVMSELKRDNPLTGLREFERSIATFSSLSSVDWSLYKEKHTETINMNFFSRLNIARATEKKMVEQGVATVAQSYAEEAPLYVKRVVAYLYGTEEEKDEVIKGMNGFDMRSGDPMTGGHPSEIDALIRLQFPLYDTSSSSVSTEDIETIVRSHFLFLYFEDTPWPEIIALLIPEQAKIIRDIRVVLTPLRGILDATLTLYKALLFYYLRQVAAALYKQQPPIIALPKAPELLLLSDKTVPSDLAMAAMYFDELNRLFKDLNPRDIIIDNLFYEYLATGNDAFATRRFMEGVGQRPVTTTSSIGEKPTKLIVNKEYPALILHDIMRAYNAYRKEYLLTSTENLARINAAIQKANRKIAEVVGDESYTLNRPGDYRQRKSFVSKIENSGFTKMRAEIVFLLHQTYNYVMDDAPNLTGLPLEAFMSDSANKSGLSTDFINVASVLDANREYSFPDGYRSKQQFIKIQLDKQGSMARMRRYIWSGAPQKGYTISKNTNSGFSFTTCVIAIPTAKCYQRPSRIMF